MFTLSLFRTNVKCLEHHRTHFVVFTLQNFTKVISYQKLRVLGILLAIFVLPNNVAYEPMFACLDL